MEAAPRKEIGDELLSLLSRGCQLDEMALELGWATMSALFKRLALLAILAQTAVDKGLVVSRNLETGKRSSYSAAH